ncbi:hypothetical protein ACFVMC_26510 [Nocardia sp. NPDC127579]|uniref:hypothetical protein n=1 Tax=Nocardia sp. NPDC127579 TaxID=3345402 RepID=UPI00362F92DA
MNMFWLTPTRSRPRATISAIADPGGIAPAAGSAVGRRLGTASHDAGPRSCGALVISAAPGGSVRTDTPGKDSGSGAEPQPTVNTTLAASVHSSRPFISTPSPPALT